MSGDQLDTFLYGAVGGLIAAQGFVATHQLPATFGPAIGIALAVCVAVKAKRSKGSKDSSDGS